MAIFRPAASGDAPAWSDRSSASPETEPADGPQLQAGAGLAADVGVDAGELGLQAAAAAVHGIVRLAQAARQGSPGQPVGPEARIDAQVQRSHGRRLLPPPRKRRRSAARRSRRPTAPSGAPRKRFRRWRPPRSAAGRTCGHGAAGRDQGRAMGWRRAVSRPRRTRWPVQTHRLVQTRWPVRTRRPLQSPAGPAARAQRRSPRERRPPSAACPGGHGPCQRPPDPGPERPRTRRASRRARSAPRRFGRVLPLGPTPPACPPAHGTARRSRWSRWSAGPGPAPPARRSAPAGPLPRTSPRWQT